MNMRFHRPPYNVGGWDMLGASGLLVHVFDGYENHESLWLPRADDISASLVYAAQHANSPYLKPLCGHQKLVPCKLPIFLDSNAGDNYAGAGLIFRPGSTPIKCGKGGDSGGHCSGWCPPLSPAEVVTFNTVQHWDIPGDGCGQSWKPSDFGAYLKRQSTWQVRFNRLEHNEIIVARGPWLSQLPKIIDAFFVRKGFPVAGTHALHRRFLAEYGISENETPLVELDVDDWGTPIRLL